MSFGYRADQFISGNVFASGYIASLSSSASNAVFYAPAQNGFVTAPVIVVFDVQGAANTGFWQIQLNRSTLVVTITYNDVDVVGGTLSWVMTPDKCVVNNY